MSVVRTYCGHGIGEYFHCAPNVPHYAKNKAKGTMKVGEIFTIGGCWSRLRRACNLASACKHACAGHWSTHELALFIDSLSFEFPYCIV